MIMPAGEPPVLPGFPDTIYGPHRLLSRWEFGGKTYLLVTVSAGDNGNITLEYMPEDAYRVWCERDARRRAKTGKG